MGASTYLFPTGRRDGPSSYLHGLCFMARSRASALSILGRLLPAGALGFDSFAPVGRRPIHPRMLIVGAPCCRMLPDTIVPAASALLWNRPRL